MREGRGAVSAVRTSQRLGCGSTIGPMVAAQLGVASVDVGSPMWAMHSARESAGVHDHAYMIAALVAAFGS